MKKPNYKNYIMKRAIYTINEVGDKLFNKIIDKLSSWKDIDKQDIIKLIFKPVVEVKIDKD